MHSFQVDLNDVNDLDIAFDGVDEVDFNKNLLKVEILNASSCVWLSLWYLPFSLLASAGELVTLCRR